MFEMSVIKWAEVNGVEQNQQLINSARVTPNLATYDSGGEGINALKTQFKCFVELVNSQSHTKLRKTDRLLKVEWCCFCRIAILLVFRDFFSGVVSNDDEPATFFNPAGCGSSNGAYGASRVIGQTQTLVATTGTEEFWRTMGLRRRATVSGSYGLVLTLPKNHGVIKERPQELYWDNLNLRNRVKTRTRISRLTSGAYGRNRNRNLPRIYPHPLEFSISSLARSRTLGHRQIHSGGSNSSPGSISPYTFDSDEELEEHL